MEIFLLVLIALAVPAMFVVFAVLKQDQREGVQAAARAVTRSLPGRLVLMTCTGLLLLIPLDMVEDLRRERGYRLIQVQEELATQWGHSQKVVGPLVGVTVLDHSEERFEKTDKDGNVKVHFRPKVEQREYLLLPQTLDVRGDVSPQALHRGLYDVLVYNAKVEIDATFQRPDLPVRPGHELEFLWHEAQLIVELSDLSAVSAVSAMDWQGQELEPESGTVPGHPQYSGIRGVLPGFENDLASVRVAVDLRGTESLLVGALGESTEVAINGTWSSPSFTGFTLPKERTVQGDSFQSSWSVPGVARPVPQVLQMADVAGLAALQEHTVGVRLVELATPYISVERALTYGVLVIVLCLLTFLVLEHMLNLKLHPVQWLVNGLALVVFYLVLLASSEHQGFQVAYGIASVVTVGMISLYTLLATRAFRAAGTVFLSLSMLYGCMFGMLRSEDNALLTGTALVVAALACTMWVTRHLGRAAEVSEPIPLDDELVEAT